MYVCIHFTTNFKTARDCLPPYNNAGLISKVSEEVATKIVWVYVYFAQLSLKVETSESKNDGKKPSLTWNSHSWTFWIIHFKINYKKVRDGLTPYNKAGLISKVSEVATKIAENCSHRQPHCRLMPPLREIPTNIAIYFFKLQSLAYIIVWDSMGLSLFKFLQWAPRHIFSAIECISAVQADPRKIILAPIEMAYASSYYSITVTLILSSNVLEIRWHVG